MLGNIGDLFVKCMRQVTKCHLYYLLGLSDYYVMHTEDAGLPYFDRAAVIANGTWLCGSALKSMGAKLCFRSCLVNIVPSYT